MHFCAGEMSLRQEVDDSHDFLENKLSTTEGENVIGKSGLLLLFVASLAGAQGKGTKGDFVVIGEEETPPAKTARPTSTDKAGELAIESEEEDEESGEIGSMTRSPTRPSPMEALKAAQKMKSEDLKTFTAVVNMIRKSGRTEVAFRNGEIYYLPSGSRHNKFYSAFEESEKSNQALSVTVNTKSRIVVGVDKAPTASDKAPGSK